MVKRMSGPFTCVMFMLRIGPFCVTKLSTVASSMAQTPFPAGKSRVATHSAFETQDFERSTLFERVGPAAEAVRRVVVLRQGETVRELRVGDAAGLALEEAAVPSRTGWSPADAVERVAAAGRVVGAGDAAGEAAAGLDAAVDAARSLLAGADLREQREAVGQRRVASGAGAHLAEQGVQHAAVEEVDRVDRRGVGVEVPGQGRQIVARCSATRSTPC